MGTDAPSRSLFTTPSLGHECVDFKAGCVFGSVDCVLYKILRAPWNSMTEGRMSAQPYSGQRHVRSSAKARTRAPNFKTYKKRPNPERMARPSFYQVASLRKALETSATDFQQMAEESCPAARSFDWLDIAVDIWR